MRPYCSSRAALYSSAFRFLDALVIGQVTHEESNGVAVLEEPGGESCYPLYVALIDALPLLRAAALAVVLHQTEPHDAAVAVPAGIRRRQNLGGREAER